MPAPVILVEVSPRRAADGGVETLRLAGGGALKPYRYPDAAGGSDQGWRGGIVTLPTMIAALSFDGADFGTGGIPQAAEILWGPSRSSDLEPLAALFWHDAPIKVRIGPEGTSPPVVLSGKVLGASIIDGRLKLSLADPAADLKKPFPLARFAGTGDLEGPAEWDGRPKRRIFGRVWNLAGDPIDKANNIYVFSDPARPILSIDAVRDRGASAAALLPLGWQGSAAATLAALRAVAAPQGGGVICPSLSLVKWWTQPSGALCADIRGENGAGYVETTAEIVASLVAGHAGTPFAAGTVLAAATARPAAVGWVIEDDTRTTAAMLDELCGNASLLWLLNSAGAIVLREWAWTASAATATSQSVQRLEQLRPVHTRRIGFQRNETVMARGDIAATVLASDAVYADGTPLEALKPADAGATRVTSTSDIADGAGLGTTAQWPNVSGVPFTSLGMNFFPMEKWVPGFGFNEAGWYSNANAGDTNALVQATGPAGTTELCLGMVEHSGGAASGGFDYNGFDASKGFDRSATYRMSIWVYRSAGASGGIYLGTNYSGVTNMDGSANGNPYFFAASDIPTDKWLLIVGIVHGQGTPNTTSSGMSGLYDPETGQRINAGADFKFTNLATRLDMRAYQFYSANGSVSYFARPRIEKLTETAPTVAQLMGVNALLNANQKWAEVGGAGKPTDYATRNDLYTGASDPGGANGSFWRDTSVTPNALKWRVGGAWVLIATFVNNTAQLVDGAQLGLTALWNGISGGGKPENNADVTLIAQPGAVTVTKSFTYDNQPKTGFPFEVPVKLIAGAGSDVTASAATSAVLKSGSASFSLTGGTLTVTAFSANSVIEMTLTYAAKTRKVQITLVQDKDAPPSTGSSGGGSSANGSVYQVGVSTTYSTTAAGQVLTAKAGATGKVDLSAFVDFYRQALGTSGAYGKWQWRTVGGVWADVTPGGESSSDVNAVRTGGAEPQNEPGAMGVTETKSGLSNGTPYEFQLLLRSEAGLADFSGNEAAVGG